MASSTDSRARLGAGVESAAPSPAATPEPPRPAEVLRGMRRAIASLRAASETLQGYPNAEPTMRERLLAVIADESTRLNDHLHALERALAARDEPGRRARVPVEAVARALAEALAASGLECDLERDGAEASPGGDPTTLQADLDALAGAAEAFFTALRRQYPVGSCTLRRGLHEGHLLLDVQWSPSPSDIPRLLSWQGEALGAGGSDAESGRLRAVVRQHDGEAWFALDRDGATARIRILLPCA